MTPALMLATALLITPVAARPADDPFAAAIRPTNALTPEHERASFHLPPGFRVQLFAAEPEIQKPMNMAFDARGRLWVSGSTEYPYPAPADRPGRDSIRVLEDTDRDGHVDKVTVFADGLSVPIGLYPYKTGVIAFSIPNIWFFDDTDGDGKADRREILYGPFDYLHDTHGMNNAFRRGFDGWLYANHGWANTSTVRGRDGNEVVLPGGNTYRVRPDGARIEHFTHGQVNPFGMTFDPLGDLFNADCHTRPIMLLLRGGHYDSFGRPHNGLGYVPPVMEHSHGSTAIAGTTLYTGLNFPREFRGNMFVGNVMTSRVNRDSIRERGASLQAIEEPDFVVSDDPWFRPVDMQVAPDGSLYIADFYNKIIGHVEVPLDHPQRDKLRGRIWRVVYEGDPGNPAPLDPSPDLRVANAKALIAAFDHPNLGVRMRAGDELCDRLGADAVAPLRDALPQLTPTPRAHALWALHRLGAGRSGEVRNAATSGDRLLRVHAMRILAGTATWDESDRSAVLHALDDGAPMVRRAAVDALGRHPRTGDLDALVKLSETTPETDVHLRHTIKLVLLEIIRVPGTLARWSAGKPLKPAADLMADIALALPSQEAGAFLLDYLGRYSSSPELTGQYLAHAAKNLPPDADVSTLAKVAQRENDLDLQLDLLMAVRNGLRQRQRTEPDDLRKWGGSLAGRLLASVSGGGNDWISSGESTAPGRPWRLEPRGSADRPGKSPFLSSLPLGEAYTGTLRSREFVLPPLLSLSVCGHLGFPDKPVEPKNMVRVRLVGSGEVVAEALAPRDDTAQRVSWNFGVHAGKPAVIEVVDGLPLSAFAWIAVARIEPPVVTIPAVEPEVVARRQKAAAELAATLGLRELEAPLKAVAGEGLADPAARAAAAKAIVSFHPDIARSALLQVVADPSVDPTLAREILADATRIDGPSPGDLLVRVMRSIPSRLQAVLAGSLAETRDGAERLLKLAEQGAAPPSLLQQPTLRDKLLATKPEGVESRLATLTASLPPVEVATQRLIDARAAAFDRAKASPARGKEVFTRQCAACHQINGQGGLVGPQLDGVGNRGHERIVEDILDPSRNVDPAFYSTLLALNDGRTLSGFVRRREGINIVLVDSTGKEQSIPAADVEQERPTKLSPMPANFGVSLAESELNDLLAFLTAGSREAPAPVSWRVVPIERRFRSEGSAIADVNRDGKPDILVGELWYEAPSWTPHEITKPGDYGDGSHSYSGCFFCYTADVNRDGWIDAIVIGTPGEPCYWFENPKGQFGHWAKHPIWPSACNETPLFVDLFGDGLPVLVMGSQPAGQQEQGQMAWFAPGPDLTQPWEMHAVSEPSASGHEVPGTRRFSHGLGAGDINRDGRLDVICTEGWWQQPAEGRSAKVPWSFHPARLGEPAAHMHAIDLDGDGRNDVVSSSAHAYGIWLHRQLPEADGKAAFERRDLFPHLTSQTHALLSEDIDGDGQVDFITGKRFWAHGPTGDPGSDEPASLYWLRTTRRPDGQITLAPYLIHNDSGVGLHFAIGDINGDKAPDIVVSNKKGIFLFEQIRPAARPGS
jgi:putative heme-binding domain-containing protein